MLQALVLNWRLNGRVGRGARRHVLVDGGSFVIPADTHASMSSHDNTVMHSQDAAGAGLGSQLRLTLGSVFSRNNKLNEE